MSWLPEALEATLFGGCYKENTKVNRPVNGSAE